MDQKKAQLIKFSQWMVKITNDNPHYKDFQFPDNAIGRVLESMKLMAKRLGGSTTIDSVKNYPADIDDHDYDEDEDMDDYTHSSDEEEQDNNPEEKGYDGIEDVGTFLDCTRPGDPDDISKINMCLTVNLSNFGHMNDEEPQRIESINWQDEEKEVLESFVEEVECLAVEEFKAELQPSECDYIWLFAFPFPNSGIHYPIARQWKRKLSANEFEDKEASAYMIMRFWIDLREYMTGEKPTTFPIKRKSDKT